MQRQVAFYSRLGATPVPAHPEARVVRLRYPLPSAPKAWEATVDARHGERDSAHGYYLVSRYSIFQVWVVPVLVVTVLMQLLFLSASASAYTL